MKQMATGYIYF